MKLLGLTCGRKMGCSEILLKEALMGAEELGIDVEISLSGKASVAWNGLLCRPSRGRGLFADGFYVFGSIFPSHASTVQCKAHCIAR